MSHMSEVVDAIFAFKNSQMFNSFLKRGQLIMQSKTKELIELDNKINKLLE